MGKDRSDFPDPPSTLDDATDAETLLELNAVILKACAADVRDRYQSTDELNTDLVRLQSGKSVRQARRMERKLALLTRVGIAALIVSALATGAFVYQREQARRSQAISEEEAQLRRVAETERQRAQAAEETAKIEASRSRDVAQFLQSMLLAVGPSVALGRDTTMLQEIMEQTARRLDELKAHPTVEADLRATLGKVYFDLGDYTSAVAMHRAALVLRKAALGELHLDVAGSLNDLGEAHFQAGNSVAAEADHRAARAIRQQLFGREHLPVAQSLNNLAETLRRQGPARHEEAEALFREALALRRKLLGNEHPDVAPALERLGLVLSSQDKFAEADAVNREAL